MSRQQTKICLHFVYSLSTLVDKVIDNVDTVDMTVDNQSRQYNLSRKEASELLKVSIRTVDRHIKSKKLSTVEYDGRIWLSSEDIEDFARPNDVDTVDRGVDSVSIDMSTPVYVDNVDKTVDNDVDSVYSVSTPKQGRPSATYEKLFNELQREIREKQERLELANYRVGQLECQVRNSIPIIEYHQEANQKKQIEEELGTQLKSSVTVIKSLSIKLRALRFGKMVLLTIVLILIALQPLWLYIIYKS